LGPNPTLRRLALRDHTWFDAIEDGVRARVRGFIEAMLARRRMFATVCASHFPLRAVAMPGPLRAVEGSGDLAERLRAGRLGLSNGWQEIG